MIEASAGVDEQLKVAVHDVVQEPGGQVHRAGHLRLFRAAEAQDDNGAVVGCAAEYGAVYVGGVGAGDGDPVGQRAGGEVHAQYGVDAIAARGVGGELHGGRGRAVDQRGCAQGWPPFGRGRLVGKREGDQAGVVEGAAEQFQADGRPRAVKPAGMVSAGRPVCALRKQVAPVGAAPISAVSCRMVG